MDVRPVSRYLSQLPACADPFLSAIAVFGMETDRLIALEADYKVEAYSPSLFVACDIDFPSRLAGAVAKRQGEFLAGRVLARAALECLRRGNVPIAIGDQGAPVWPIGISGSISHSHGKCVCLLVADENRLVGIDVEKVATGAALDAILKEALSAEERNRVLRQTRFDATLLATLIFSAKETIFKALHPVVRQFFGFDAAIFNGIGDDDRLRFSIVQSLDECMPKNAEIRIDFETGGGFARTWAILDRHMLEPRAGSAALFQSLRRPRLSTAQRSDRTD